MNIGNFLLMGLHQEKKSKRNTCFFLFYYCSFQQLMVFVSINTSVNGSIYKVKPKDDAVKKVPKV